MRSYFLVKNERVKKYEKDKGECCDYVLEIDGSFVNIEQNYV